MASSQRRSDRNTQRSKRLIDMETTDIPKSKKREHALSQAIGELDLTQNNASQANISLTQGPTSSQNAGNESFDENEAVSRVVRYLLLADRTKQPVSRQNIQKHAITGNHKSSRKIIEKAKQYLKQIFGYKLVEIENNKFILCNKLANPLLYPYYTKLEKSHLILLFITLSHLFMNGGSCREEALWEFFRQLGIMTTDDSQHDFFGNVKYLISTEFVKQRYLEINKIQETDMVKFEYQWGPRADEELSTREVLAFVAKVYDAKDMKEFKIQYKAMEAKEQEMSD